MFWNEFDRSKWKLDRPVLVRNGRGWKHQVIDMGNGDLVLCLVGYHPEGNVLLNCEFYREISQHPRLKYVALATNFGVRKGPFTRSLIEFRSFTPGRRVDSPLEPYYVNSIYDFLTHEDDGLAEAFGPNNKPPSQTYVTPAELYPEFPVPKEQGDMGIFRASRELAARGITATLTIGQGANALVQRSS